MAEIKCFKNRDFGGILYRAIGYSLILVAVLLFITTEISKSYILIGLKTLTLIFGVAFIACYFLNKRTRFRPGWTLPLGILLMFVGVGYLLCPIILPEYYPSIGITTVVLGCAFVNAVLLLSTGIQLKSLTLRRFAVILFLGCLNLAFFAGIFANVFGLRANDYAVVALFAILLGVQSILEGIYPLWKK